MSAALSDNLDSWRRILAGTDDEERRWTNFELAAREIAGCVGNGFDHAAAADELTEMATAYGLDDIDRVQTILGRAFKEDAPEINWPEPEPKPNGQHAPVKRPRILSKAEFLAGFVPPDYLVEGLLQRRFIYSLTGQTGHAKTAVALLLARLVGCTDEEARLGPHGVDKGRVLYFVGENPDDVRMRVIGSDAMRDDRPEADNICFLPGVFNIAEMFGTIEADIRQHGDVAMIIVDTAAAYFLGNEELSNTQMGAYARLLRRLTTLPGGPTVLVLCHPIKHALEPSQLLPRGGGAYLAEMDGNLTLWRLSDEVVELSYGKLRGPGFQPISFRIESIKTEKLVDRRGRELSTVRAIPISQREEEAQADRLTEDEDRVLAMMLAMPAGSFAKWAEELKWVTDGGAVNKKRVERLVTSMSNQRPKLVRKVRNKWTLTDEGKEQARAAALKFERECLSA